MSLGATSTTIPSHCHLVDEEDSAHKCDIYLSERETERGQLINKLINFEFLWDFEVDTLCDS